MCIRDRPEDAEAVIIYAPTLDISAEEAETLKTYIKGGGDIVLITGYAVSYTHLARGPL